MRYDFETEDFVVHGTQYPCTSKEMAFALGRNNGGENVLVQPVAIQGNLIGRDAGGPHGLGASDDGVMYTLTKADVHGVAQPIGGVDCENNAHLMDEPSGPLLKGSHTGGGRPLPALVFQMAVRRLTPVECERLQGFLDNYTKIPWRTYQEAQRKGISYETLLAERGMTLRGPSVEECPDGPRYKALGNSWAVPVVNWIGRRIQMVEEVSHASH